MTISPSTDLYLLKLPIELNDENQLTFATAAAQATYFQSLTKIGQTDFTYQRRENAIRYPAQIDSIIQYNYVMYKNENYSNKWFYARITNMQYINDGMTLIEIEEDSFQTWQFDLGYSQCFVEREHVNNDTIGAHTIPEGIETGEYEIIGRYNIPLYESANPSQDWIICFCVTTLLQNTNTIVGEGLTVGGVFTSLHFFAVADVQTAYAVIWAYDKLDSTVTSDAIKNVFMIPKSAAQYVENPTTWTYNNGAINIPVYPINDSVTTGPFYHQQNERLAGQYQPRNNKLFCWPYSYAYFANNAGDVLTVHWEDFPIQTVGSGTETYTARTIGYKKALVPSASLSAKLYFTHYKNWEEGASYGTRLYNYGINFAKAPICAWTTDYYTNWLTQNGVNQATSIAGAGIGGALAVAGAAIAGGPVGLAIAGAIAGTATTVANAMAQQHQASVAPDNANGDLSAGDVMFAYTKCSIGFYKMSVRSEMAAVIDKYFDCYGYKVNDVKVPNITGRQNWNYVKTVGSAIHADIPQDSCDHINHMFDNGLTLWHNPSTFRDYSQSNEIVVLNNTQSS